MKSQICLSLFVLLVGIFSFTQVQGSELTALDFEQIDFLFPIENEETSAALLSSGDTVIAVSEEEGTNPSEEEGTNPVEEEAGSTDPDPETTCSDKNCATCTTDAPAVCTVCKPDYELINGGCKAIPNKVNCKIRFNTEFEEYGNQGGDKNFEDKYTVLLGLNKGQVRVISSTKGSIIVDFDVYITSTSKFTATQIKKNLDTLAKDKTGGLDIYGGGISDYYGSSVVAVAGGCPAGQYADANNVCQACEEGCDTCDNEGKCKKTNVGAIVGGVLGGIALILVLVVAYIKRDVLLKGLSS